MSVYNLHTSKGWLLKLDIIIITYVTLQKMYFLLSVIWITVIFLIWNVADYTQQLENIFRIKPINTSQPVSTTIMTTEDEPLHTAVPSNDEVWKD